MSTIKVDSEHDQLVSMLNQLLDEREMLTRENEYLKAKLNESILMETIKEMKKERDLLFKLLSNLAINTNTNTNNNNKDEQSKLIKYPIKEINHSSTPSGYNPSTTMNRARVHRLKTNIEQQPTIAYPMKNPDGLTASSTIHIKHPQTNKKILLYKTSTQESNKLIRKPDIQLMHSQNSPFQQYRSQSLQNLT